MPDFKIENHGSIILMQPLTGSADEWLRENTDGTWYGGALVVEPRYIEALLEGVALAGYEFH